MVAWTSRRRPGPLLADVNAGAAVQGGSTIAQQLVKNTYLTDQKTLSRKVREAVLAERLEEKYTKSQVLDAYLNLVYLGSGAYGVEAAAKEYFNEDAEPSRAWPRLHCWPGLSRPRAGTTLLPTR